jgi:hypothetical protein
MLKAKLTRAATVAAVIVFAALTVAPAARAAYLPNLYTIQATKPTAPAPRDHRDLFVAAQSSSTTEPVRLSAWTNDPIQRQRFEWLLDQQSREFDGKTYTAYVLVNRRYGGCLTWIKPLMPMGRGTRVGLAAYPQNCMSWPQKWVLNNGSHWVRLSDPHGTRVGFQLNLPVRPGEVLCLDITGFNHAAGNHLQEWTCTGAWNQRFLIKPTRTR